MSVTVDVADADAGAGEAIAAAVRRAVVATLEAESVSAASVSVTLLDDARIRALNREYLAHDYATDVLAFPLYEAGEPVVGDIYIGFERAREQAAEAGVVLEEEVARLAIHGTLHVLGYDHPEKDDRTQTEMWQRQEEILQSLAS